MARRWRSAWCLRSAFRVASGLCPAGDAERVATHLTEVGLPIRIGDVPGWTAGSDAMLDVMFQDKKVTQGRLNLILSRGIGRSFVANDRDASAVRRFLDDELTRT